MEGIGSVDQSNALYSIYANQDTKTWVQNYTIQITGSQGTLPGQQVSLWNASIYKDFLRDRSIQLRLSAFGILNTPSSFTQTVGLNYVQTQQTNIPGRIILLSLIYRFHHFPAVKHNP